MCVVGLGASGLAAILELIKTDNKLSIVGIDAKDVASCAAGQNGGMLLAGLDSEHHDNVARRGRDTASELYKETVEELLSIFVDYPDCTK